jgi:NADPH:quinone reductase-like Zn-dependent oxidoreductase
MSRVISYAEFGPPSVLKLSDVDPAPPGAGQVLIAVRAIGVNPLDAKIRRGELARIFPVNFPVVPGLDVAGVIDAIGPDVTGLRVGDEVFGVASEGSYAQHVVADADAVQPRPPALPWELAAALPTVGEAAVRTLEQLEVKAGDVLLIHGAAGSVGAIATQLAVSRGATVIGAVSEADMDVVRGLGANPVLAGEELARRVRRISPDGVSAVLDTSGAGVLPESIDLAGGPERIVTIADMAAAGLGVRFSGAEPTDRAHNALPPLAHLAAGGQLQLPIWRPYPLADAAAAHADLEARRNRGKLVLLP